MPSDNEILSQFLADIERAGIVPLDTAFQPILDGELHRFSVQGDRSGATSGAYRLHTDGRPAWYAKDFRKGIEIIGRFEFSLRDKEEYARAHAGSSAAQRQAELDALRQASIAKQRAEANAKRENQQAAILEAWRLYEHSSRNIAGHPYVQAKKLRNFAGMLRVDGRRNLLIPFHGINGEFRGLQRIFSQPDEHGHFTRGFLKNCPISGNFLELSCGVREWVDLTPAALRPNTTGYFPRQSPLMADTGFITEGYATAAAVYSLANTDGNSTHPVFVSFSSTNILAVAKALHESYPKMKLIIAADNDKAGIDAANKTIAAGYAIREMHPEIEGADWFDIWAKNFIQD